MASPGAPRRFKVLDGLALIAATAVGLSLVRLTEVDWSFPYWPRQPMRFLLASNMIVRAVALILVCLAAAVLACGLVPAGPPRRWRLREPGLLGCVCVCATAPLPWAWHHTLRLVGLNPDININQLLHQWLDGASSAVFLCWAALLLTGRWRPAPSWTNHAGHAICIMLLALELWMRACLVILYATR